MTSPVIIKLKSSEFNLRWTPRCEARLSMFGYSLDRVVTELRISERVYYVLCLLIWCSVVERDGFPYKVPEDVAEAIPTVDDQSRAFAAVRQAMEEAGVLEDSKKKSQPEESPSKTGLSQ